MFSARRLDGTRTLLAIVLIGMLVRGSVCFWGLQNYSADPDAYRAIAETVANTGVYGLTDRDGNGQPTAFRPPLYPYLLSWITSGGKLSNVAVAVLHTILGAITVACTFLASRSLLGDTFKPAIGVLAAALVAVDPILLQQSTLVMTETVATALASVILWWWTRHCESASGRWVSLRWAIVLGALLSLAYLCRPTFLVWAVMLCLAVPWAGEQDCQRPRSWLRRLSLAVAVGSVVLATVCLWTLRNWREIGHPVWATTHGGYTLLLGNNPSFYDYLENGEFGSTWDPESFFISYSHRYDGDPESEEFWETRWKSTGTIVRSVTENEDDRVAHDAARATIDRQPGWFLWSCAVRLGRLWTPMPHHTPDRSWLGVAAIGSYYVIFYVAMLAGLWRLRSVVLGYKWWPLLMLAVTLSVVHAVYWSNLRMRAPIVPALAIIAAVGFSRTGVSPRASPTR